MRPVAPAARSAWPAVLLAHLAAVAWLLGGALFEGRLLYYRDLSLQFAPDYAFAAASLRQGIWPLWNPLANAGEPCLFAYPVDLVLLGAGGARAPLGAGAALHLLVALVGASALGRRLGMGPAGAWLAGVVYGLGGFVLSTVNLLPLFQAAAWAPWVLAALVGLVRAPSPRRAAALAALAALQASTLAAEIVLQTALVGLVLVAGRDLLRRDRVLALAGAGALAAALAAPALLGARALLAGSARERGFPASEALAFSAHPVVMAEALVPKLLGDPHGFTDAGFWGRAYFPSGHPYLLTLYVGLAVLVVASRARGRRRLWGLVAAGLVLALGSHGPLGLLGDGVRLPLRGPQKLLFLAHVAVALLAGFGLERAASERARRLGTVLLAVPGAALLAAAFALRAGAAPPLAPPDVAALVPLWLRAWPAAGVLALAAGLAVARGGRLALAAGVLAALDLLTAGSGVNPQVPPSFYEMRPEVAAAVRPLAREGPYRFFSYGVAYTPGLRFEARMAGARSDAWLFYLDRQALLPRTPALDGLESAFGVDRTGWSPPGSTLAVEEARPSLFETHRPRLEEGGVRWVLSFEPLPTEGTARRGEVTLPGVAAPLGFYELPGAWPRAYWAATLEGPRRPPPPLPEAATVRYDRVDAHTVVVEARTPPGWIVVLDGHHPDWVAEVEPGGAAEVRPAGRYRAVATPGGERRITLRYRPRWRAPALAIAAAAALVALALARRA